MLIFGLFLAAIASWVSVRRIRSRVEELSHTIEEQQSTIDVLTTAVEQLRRRTREAPVAAADFASRPAPTVAPAPSPVAAPTPAPVQVPPPVAAPPPAPPAVTT